MGEPVIALTMGDGAGVGPEIIMKIHCDAGIFESCRPLVLGDAKRVCDRPARSSARTWRSTP